MPDFSAAYTQTHDRLDEILRPLDEATSSRTVPACPLWSIKDLVAHLTHIATSYAAGHHIYPLQEVGDRYVGALRSDWWPEADAWTQAGVDERRSLPLDEVLDEWGEATSSLCQMIAGGGDLDARTRELLSWAGVIDLATHADDIRGALGLEADRDAYATKLGYASHVFSAELRAKDADVAPVKIVTQRGELSLGDGTSSHVIEMDWFELGRALVGRRTVEQIQQAFGSVDATPYVDLLTVHPPPESPLPI